MRIIETSKKGRVIESPWMREDDAAAYCGISRSEFHERAKDLPHAGKYRLRIYHKQVLDQWLFGELALDFDAEEKPLPAPIKVGRIKHVNGITNPVTGKFRPCVQQA